MLMCCHGDDVTAYAQNRCSEIHNKKCFVTMSEDYLMSRDVLNIPWEVGTMRMREVDDNDY